MNTLNNMQVHLSTKEKKKKALGKWKLEFSRPASSEIKCTSVHPDICYTIKMIKKKKKEALANVNTDKIKSTRVHTINLNRVTLIIM